MSMDNNEHKRQYYVLLEVGLKFVNLSKVYASSAGRVVSPRNISYSISMVILTTLLWPGIQQIAIPYNTKRLRGLKR
jgi:hypothetical protein